MNIEYDGLYYEVYFTIDKQDHTPYESNGDPGVPGYLDITITNIELNGQPIFNSIDRSIIDYFESYIFDNYE